MHGPGYWHWAINSFGHRRWNKRRDEDYCWSWCWKPKNSPKNLGRRNSPIILGIKLNLVNFRTEILEFLRGVILKCLRFRAGCSDARQMVVCWTVSRSHVSLQPVVGWLFQWKKKAPTRSKCVSYPSRRVLPSGLAKSLILCFGWENWPLESMHYILITSY